MTEQRAQLVPVDASVIAIRGNLTESGYVPPEDLKRHEWEAAGQSFRSVERASRFWIGDWVIAGERMYGVTYKRAAELTGREESDIRSMASVSGRVPVANRLTNRLSWSHHAAVADLASELQKQWLEAALSNNWSKTELRRQILAKQKHVVPTVPKCSRCGTECAVCRAEIGPNAEKLTPSGSIASFTLARKVRAVSTA